MQAITLGDSGEPVRDLQTRLVGLGYSPTPDLPGEFDVGTLEALQRFQLDRGLEPDGVLDPRTWQILVESGYHLGDRVLYHRRPMLRGDDVAELQRRLNDLGFDADKVDGVFGPLTAGAVSEFQHNRGMSVDGIAGPAVIGEVVSVQRPSRRIGKETARELAWLRTLPTTPIGTRILFDAGCDTESENSRTWPVAHTTADAFQKLGGTGLLSRSSDVMVATRVRARRANRLGANLVVSVQLPGFDPLEGAFYFDSGISTSPAGALLAQALGSRLDLPVAGRSLPILRETRAPAVVLASESIGADWTAAIVAGLSDFFARAAEESR